MPVLKNSDETFSHKDIPDSIYQIANAAIWHRMFRRDLLIKNDVRFQEGVPILDDIYFINVTLVLARAIAIVPERLVYYRKGRPDAQTGAISKNLCSVYKSFLTFSQ